LKPEKIPVREIRRINASRSLLSALQPVALTRVLYAVPAGFGVRAPDRHQLMDYEAGRSNAHPTTKQVLASALGVPVDDLEAAPCAPLKMPAHLPVAVNSPLPCAPSYKTGIFIVRDETDFVAPPSRLST
jgi:hypothetical protein